MVADLYFRQSVILRLFQMALGVLTLLTFASAAQSETRLNASVDRDKIYQQDTINLSVSGEIDMEFSIGGLMNFSRNQITEPELGDLESDFDILDQNQSYNMRSINGDTKAQVSWNYTLAPKRTGALTIPPISYQGASSNEISINVMPGKAPRNTDTPPNVFIEAIVDKQSAYVQEQVLYTLRLYSADHLASGELSDPSPVDAIVEELGDTKKYFRMAYNQRYEVRERKYLIFPQKSGELLIEPQQFNGMLIDTRTRKRSRVRESSDAITLDIKAPPAEFSGQVWLPATSLELTEKWDKEPYDLKVGDSLTRTLEISSLGLLGSALPPFQTIDLKGLKIYPDQPVLESYEHESGAQSRRSETSAMVAISPVDVTLPEVKIPWWDTVNDVERVAVLPSRSFTISPSAVQPQSTPAQPQLEQTITATDQSAQPDYQQLNSASSPAVTQTPVNEMTTNNQPWYLIIFLLVTGWISTTWFLLKRQKALTTLPPKSTSMDTGLEPLIKAIKSSSPEIPKLLVSWANALEHNEREIHCINDLKALDSLIFETAQDIEKQLYANSGPAQTLTFDKTELIQRIKELSKGEKAERKATELQPMYP